MTGMSMGWHANLERRTRDQLVEGIGREPPCRQLAPAARQRRSHDRTPAHRGDAVDAAKLAELPEPHQGPEVEERRAETAT